MFCWNRWIDQVSFFSHGNSIGYEFVTVSCSSGMFDRPVTIRAGASLLGWWLLPRVQQHQALIAVSLRSNLRGATHTQQLRRQNFCSSWFSFVELTSCSAAWSRHCLWIVQTTVEGTSFLDAWAQCSVTSDMWRLRKTFTYLLLAYSMPYFMEFVHIQNKDTLLRYLVPKSELDWFFCFFTDLIIENLLQQCVHGVFSLNILVTFKSNNSFEFAHFFLSYIWR